MSHPLDLYSKQISHGRRLEKPLLTVKVERFGYTKASLTLATTAEPPSLARGDAVFVPLPKEIKVISQDGEPITPTWKFWISTETFDPFHLLIDWDGN